MSATLEADLAAIADFERLVSQRLFYRLFSDADIEQPGGSPIHARAKHAIDH